MELPGRSDWGQPPEHKAAGAAGSIHCSRDLIYANTGASRPGTMECLNPLRQGEEESPHPHLTLVNAKLDPALKEQPSILRTKAFLNKPGSLFFKRSSPGGRGQPGAVEAVGNFQECTANWRKPRGMMGVIWLPWKGIRTEPLRTTVDY